MIKQKNPQAYTIYHDPKFIYIVTNKNIFSKQQFLKIDREYCKMTESSTLDEQQYIKKQTKKLIVPLMMGIINILGQPFLICVKQCIRVATITKDLIFIIKNILFLPFRHNFSESTFGYNQMINKLNSIKDLIINQNFYFSYTYDITQNLQHKYTKDKLLKSFFWNQSLLKPFTRYQLQSCWKIPVVQGFITSYEFENQYFCYYYIIISRRSKYMSGSRFYCKGLDEQSNAANFVETEQILVCHNYIISNVYLRGWIPTSMVQQGTSIKMINNGMNKQLSNKHYQKLERNYGKIITINLLSKKNEQKQLIEYLQQLLLKDQNRIYIHYDFSEELKNKEDVQIILNKFIDQKKTTIFPSNNLFIIDYFQNQIIQLQYTFHRINCWDCLDRTNTIMYKISQKTIELFSFFINNNVKIKEKQIKINQKFKDLHRQAWKQNGDKISLIQCGTPSVLSYITPQKSNNSLFGYINNSFKSLNRSYNTNINHQLKQQCHHLFLQTGGDCQTDYFNDNIQKNIDPSKYCTFQRIGIYILTWNCNQLNPEDLDDQKLTKLINFNQQSTDLIMICLQQIVELNTYNVLIGGKKTIPQLWRERLKNHLEENFKRKYFYVIQSQLVGVFTLLFVAEDKFQHISCLNSNQVKTGFSGNLGNKGGVILNFKYDDSILTFINCHLEAGQGKVTERLSHIEMIHKNCFEQRTKRRLFFKSDFRFLIGDLNFRIDLPLQQVKQQIYSIEKYIEISEQGMIDQSINRLLSRDQLLLNLKNSQMLSKYKENVITFMPTYKYIKKTNQYDGKSKKIPSWCDRILYNGSIDRIDCNIYGRKQLNDSDHKPVFSEFNVYVRKQNLQKKEQLIKEYIN